MLFLFCCLIKLVCCSVRDSLVKFVPVNQTFIKKYVCISDNRVLSVVLNCVLSCHLTDELFVCQWFVVGFNRLSYVDGFGVVEQTFAHIIVRNFGFSQMLIICFYVDHVAVVVVVEKMGLLAPMFFSW